MAPVTANANLDLSPTFMGHSPVFSTPEISQKIVILLTSRGESDTINIVRPNGNIYRSTLCSFYSVTILICWFSLRTMSWVGLACTWPLTVREITALPLMALPSPG